MDPIGGTIGGDIESGIPRPMSNNNAPTGLPDHLETLDEPVSQTILRDLRQIAIKTRHVLMPGSNGLKELRDWDLWGPLLLCLLLAVSLSFSAADNQAALVFAAVFVIVWCGAGVVTLNALLLGGTVSFFQSVCVLGYCIAPLNIASLLCHLWSHFIYKFIVAGVCFLWATRASIGFMAQLVPKDRKMLGVYPIVLFYLVLAWMVIVQ